MAKKRSYIKKKKKKKKNITVNTIKNEVNIDSVRKDTRPRMGLVRDGINLSLTEIDKLKPTLRFILSSCLFWFSTSVPMSWAMFLRLPIMVETCCMFSSISSSRSSLVILSVAQKHQLMAAACSKSDKATI